MTKTADQLPADPAQLHLAYAFGHGLHDDAHERTVERWEIAVRHGFEVHDDERCPTLTGPEGADNCVGECPAFFEDGVRVGSMVFYRIRMVQGMNSFWAMEEESQELYEIAEVLIDSDTGHFVDELDEDLAGFGSDLLVMDQVVLDKSWRGFGLGQVLAGEAINRLAPGAQVVACSPGISDREDMAASDDAEWERVTAKIAAGWQRVGFKEFKEGVYVIDTGTVAADNALSELRKEFDALTTAWRELPAAGQ
ncbi:hypothetical protein [Streptomyces fildesensis]|uniref:hypothetical protein n=1 Tax=Streptomyces fildesensis TaxID=375757 RepID=UPI0018DFBD74|nr:hypothetical protein [Streptomyces fildesensis]